jgi:hypothetical protein
LLCNNIAENVKLERRGSKFVIINGFHRCFASIILNREFIRADVSGDKIELTNIEFGSRPRPNFLAHSIARYCINSILDNIPYDNAIISESNDSTYVSAIVLWVSFIFYSIFYPFVIYSESDTGFKFDTYAKSKHMRSRKAKFDNSVRHVGNIGDRAVSKQRRDRTLRSLSKRERMKLFGKDDQNIKRLIRSGKCPDIISESGFDMSTFVDEFVSLCGNDVLKRYSKSEISLMCYSLVNLFFRYTNLWFLLTDLSVLLCTITQGNFPKSMFLDTAFSLLFSDKVESREDIVSESVSSRERVTKIKEVIKNWKIYRKSDIAIRIHTLVCYTLALLGQKDLNLGSERFSLYKAKAAENVNAVDFGEYIMGSLIFFIERGQDVFDTGDISEIFSSESEDYEFEKEYNFLLGNSSLLASGNLHQLNCDQQSFDLRLERCTKKCEYMMKFTKDKVTRHVLSSKLLQLTKLRTDFIHALQNKGLRERPFSLLCFGKSAVAKSKLSALLCNTILKQNGFPSEAMNVITLNSEDKFQSEYRSYHNAVIMDDLANCKPNMCQSSPLISVLMFVNNVQQAALSPIAELKGNIMLQPKVVIGTTNKKDLNSYVYSEEPVSIVRRFDYTLTVKVKDDYRRPGSHMIDPAKVSGETVPDAWLIDVETVKPIPREGGADAISYVPAVWNGMPLTNITLDTLNKFLFQVTKVHYKQQKELVKGNDEMFNTSLCQHGSYAQICTDCQPQSQSYDFDVTDNLKLLETSLCMFSIANVLWSFLQFSVRRKLEIRMTKALFRFSFVRNHILNIFRRSNLRCVVNFFYLYAIIILILCISCDSYLRPFIMTVCGLLMYTIVSLIAIIVRVYADERLSAFSEVIVHLGKRHRSTLFKNGILALGICGSAFLVCRVFYKIYTVYSQSAVLSNILPTENEKVDPWKKCAPAPLPVSLDAANTTSEQLLGVVKRKLCHVTIRSGEGLQKCQAFPLESNLWLFPGHSIPEGNFSVSMTRVDPNTAGSNFHMGCVGGTAVWRHPKYDYAIVVLYGSSPNKDLTKFLPLTYMDRAFAGTLVYKNECAETSLTDVRCEHFEDIHASRGVFKGFSYAYESTFSGMCMAPIVSHTKRPAIMGFHLAGNKRDRGYAGTLLQSDVSSAKTHFSRTEHLMTVSEGQFRTVRYGVDIQFTPEVHRRCPLNFTSDGASFEIYGSHPKRRTFRSNVVSTLITDSVTKHCGVPSKYGPPKDMNSYVHWYNDMEKKTHCTASFDPDILRESYSDFGAQMMGAVLSNVNKSKNIIRPLPMDAVLAGLDGVYGIERINLNSSMGFPICKPKKDFITPSDREVEGITAPLDCPQFILDEMEEMENAFLRGERCYAIQRGNLKDTATKISKNKVRVFSGCDTAFLLLVRKYMLWVCKLTMENSFAFECAVGINCQGPEWTKFTQHINKYGESRIIAGDYAGFDGTMAAQIMMYSFNLIIKMAEWSGNFDTDDIKIMRGIATEICYPLYEFNGEFVQFFGSNPSGQPLTVIINNFCNSMYLRYAYYAIYPSTQIRFNEVVSVMCYGDDNKMSVKEGFDEFNHTRVAEELLKVGITYTMADKESTSVPFIHTSQATFLKRYSVWNAEVGQYFAPIEEDSIFKSLHCVLASKELTQEEHAAEVINNAINEWFFHGEEIYTSRLKQIESVIRDHSLDTYLPPRLPFNDKLAQWREKYNV